MSVNITPEMILHLATRYEDIKIMGIELSDPVIVEISRIDGDKATGKMQQLNASTVCKMLGVKSSPQIEQDGRGVRAKV